MLDNQSRDPVPAHPNQPPTQAVIGQNKIGLPARYFDKWIFDVLPLDYENVRKRCDEKKKGQRRSCATRFPTGILHRLATLALLQRNQTECGPNVQATFPRRIREMLVKD
jgi:hypothetical protein